MQPVSPTSNPLAAALQALDPTGTDSFEGLVAKMLSDLTGVSFRPARSGPQRGRDFDLDPASPWFAVVECKRYHGDTKLDQRELIAEIHIATSEDPQIDIWILATSRDVDANVARWLQEMSRERGIDYLILQCGSAGDPGDLDVLCANASALVLQHCAPVLPKGTSELETYLTAVRSGANFSARLQRISNALDGGTVGLPTFRDRLNEKLGQAMRSEDASVGRFERHRRLATVSAAQIPHRDSSITWPSLEVVSTACQEQVSATRMSGTSRREETRVSALPVASDTARSSRAHWAAKQSSATVATERPIATPETQESIRHRRGTS